MKPRTGEIMSFETAEAVSAGSVFKRRAAGIMHEGLANCYSLYRLSFLFAKVIVSEYGKLETGPQLASCFHVGVLKETFQCVHTHARLPQVSQRVPTCSASLSDRCNFPETLLAFSETLLAFPETLLTCHLCTFMESSGVERTSHEAEFKCLSQAYLSKELQLSEEKEVVW